MKECSVVISEKCNSAEDTEQIEEVEVNCDENNKCCGVCATPYNVGALRKNGCVFITLSLANKLAMILERFGNKLRQTNAQERSFYQSIKH